MQNWIFSKNKKIYSINKYQSSNKQKELIVERLNQEILKIDRKLSKETQELLQTEVTGIKAALSNQNNWLHRLQKKFYWQTIQNSAKWQRGHVQKLYQERRSLQTQLDRLSGKFWIKQIRYWLGIAILAMVIIFAAWIVFMGMLTTLYLLPIWGSVLIVYLYFQKKSNTL